MTRDPYKELERAHRYVGRFLWSFANAEVALDELLIKLYGLNNLTAAIVIGSLDIQRKLNFVRLGLRHQGGDLDAPRKLERDEESVFSEFNKLRNARNIIAHSAYLPEMDAIIFTYKNASNDSIKPYEEYSLKRLDDLFAMARRVSDGFYEMLKTCKELKEADTALRTSILEITNTNGDNVIPFPQSPRDP
jgi:hypothetical protein